LDISAETALCGIALHPAGHTRSPAMHNAAYAALGIDAVYVAFDVRPSDLANAVAGTRALRARQLSISLPHKQTIMAHLDEVDATARQIGAVNTVIRREDALLGSNTDWLGAVGALERETTLAGKRAVVLGAGGTARAVVYGLLAQGASVRVLNRTVEKARVLADELGADDAGGLSELSGNRVDVLVNATRVGLGEDVSPVEASQLPSEAVVMDAVYQPERTRLLRDAEARGARTVSGKWMLVHQAVAQLEAWTGRKAPIDVMAEAFDRAGSRRAP
jgi:shikimate dehydrogenase